jgi:hypothetical protein
MTLHPQQPSPTTTSIDYVHLKAVQEPASTTVDFETAKAACHYLFHNFVTTQEAGNSSTHAIPDLLEVIRYVETYRLRIIHQAELALDPWQEYYKKEDPQKSLSEEEAALIDEIARPKVNWREVYLRIVDKLVGLVCHSYFYFSISLIIFTLQRTCTVYLSRQTGPCRSSWFDCSNTALRQ